MRLLVSVSDGNEAAAALAAGADIIDAKDPAAGPLGAVAIAVLREIGAGSARNPRHRRPRRRADEDAVEGPPSRPPRPARGSSRLASRAFRTPRAVALLRAAVRGALAGCDRCGVVAVAYADADQVASLYPDALVDAAAAAGTAGVLLDTAIKSGPGLRGLIDRMRCRRGWRAPVKGGLMVAVAGRLPG